MSDLTATNCGCNNGCGSTFGNGCNWLWIILLFSCFGNGTSGLFGNSGCGCNGNENNSCEWLIWILLISCLCGNNNS